MGVITMPRQLLYKYMDARLTYVLISLYYKSRMFDFVVTFSYFFPFLFLHFCDYLPNCLSFAMMRGWIQAVTPMSQLWLVSDSNTCTSSFLFFYNLRNKPHFLSHHPHPQPIIFFSSIAGYFFLFRFSFSFCRYHKCNMA